MLYKYIWTAYALTYVFMLHNSKGRTKSRQVTKKETVTSYVKLVWVQGWAYKGTRTSADGTPGHEKGFWCTDTGWRAQYTRGRASTAMSWDSCCYSLQTKLTQRHALSTCSTLSVTSLTKDRCQMRGFLGKFQTNRKLLLSYKTLTQAHVLMLWNFLWHTANTLEWSVRM